MAQSVSAAHAITARISSNGGHAATPATVTPPELRKQTVAGGKVPPDQPSPQPAARGLSSQPAELAAQPPAGKAPLGSASHDQALWCPV